MFSIGTSLTFTIHQLAKDSSLKKSAQLFLLFFIFPCLDIFVPTWFLLDENTFKDNVFGDGIVIQWSKPLPVIAAFYTHAHPCNHCSVSDPDSC